MTTFVDQPYYGWSHEELSHQDESQEVSVSQMIDHGSISFGRFALESLSWEKRSVFTHDRRQEELEKFKSPGLVAKKKAYFEEHYKKIRAMKALQESQQTELMLDSGGDSSISSQAGEEDGRVIHHERLRDGTADVNAHSEDASTEVAREKEKELGEALELQTKFSDLENLDSLRNSSEEMEQERNSGYPFQMQYLDTNIPIRESVTISMEESQQNDLANPDDQGIPDENGNLVANTEPEIASQVTVLCPSTSEPAFLELEPAHDIVSKKVMPAAGKYKGRVSIPRRKESSAQAKSGSKLGCKPKLDMGRQSREPKYPFRKTDVKTQCVAGPSKATVDKGLRNSKSTFAASQRSLAEIHSNVTIPRPFTLATDRRAALPSGIREGALKSDPKAPKKLASSVIAGKGSLSVQDSSKRTAMMSDMKGRGLESKRCHEEKKKPLALGSHYTSIMERGANVRGPVKARSIDFRACSKFSSNGETNNRVKEVVSAEKQKERKDEARLRELRQAGSKFVAPSAGSPRTDTKKVVPSRTSNLPTSGRKLRFGEQSLDGKKPRQEKPRWR